MEIDAAVTDGPSQPFRVTRLLLGDDAAAPPAPASSSSSCRRRHHHPLSLRPTEVLVRIVATGVCHTDIAIRQGHIPFPMPAVLGHEGCGVVEATGDAVSAGDGGVKVGDHVVMCFASCGSCGNCAAGKLSYCARHRDCNFGGTRAEDGSRTVRWSAQPDGRPDGDGGGDTAGSGGGGEADDGEREGGGGRPPVHGSCFQQSSFATHALCTPSNLVAVPKDLPLSSLAPLGCSVGTGAGAVLCALRCPPGSTIAVFGVGGVGMCAAMAASASGCAKVVAVDVNDGRLDLARSVGATHAVNSRDAVRAKEELMGLVGGAGGYDFALDTTGRPEVLRLAVECLRPTGVAGLIGGSNPGAEFKVDMLTILLGRTVRGIIQGDARPRELIPKLIELHRMGKMPFDRIITYYDGLDRINDAVQDSADGTVIKPVIRVSEEPAISIPPSL